jgi:hypothetical protein
LNSGQYIVICLRKDEDLVHCDVDASNFPQRDLSLALKLIKGELRKLRRPRGSVVGRYDPTSGQ